MKILKYITVFVVAVVLIFALYYSVQTMRSSGKFEDANGGVWIGQWDSNGMGDGGDLKLKLSFIECDKYSTVWMADHYAVFTSTIDTPMMINPVKDKPGEYTLSGEVDLGLEGIHEYSGNIVKDVMTIEWKSKLDYGTLELKRVD